MRDGRLRTIGALTGWVVLASIGSAAAGDAPRSGGTLRVLDYLEWTCLSPAGSTTYANTVISNHFLERLVYQDPDTAELSGWLATKWESNPQSTEFRFTLRDDVTFSDGSRLTADVVKANLDQIVRGDPSLAIPGWSLIANYDRTEVEAPNRIAVYFTRPNVSFPQQLSISRAAIISDSSLKLTYREQCLGKNVITTGPFVFESERQGKQISFKRREDYNWAPPVLKHKGPAYLDRFVHTIATEGSVRAGTLLAGQADAARGILPSDEPLVKQAKGYRIEVIPANVTNQLVVNSNNPNLADARVRRALNLAADRTEIKQALLSDSYALASSILSRSNPGWADNSDKLRHDPKTAAALLEEAGWKLGPDGYRYKDGGKLTLSTYISPHHITSQGGFELLAEQWKRVGIELVIRRADAATYAKVQRDGNVNVFFQTSQTRFDIDSLRNTWDSAVGNQANRTIPELDEWVRRQNESADPATRKEIAAQVQAFVIDNGLSIPLYEDVLVYGVADHVRGIGHEAQGRPYFLTTWLAR